MKIISFYSDKGGVGKTFYNNFFANYLANKKHTVTIIDTVKGHRGLSSDIQTVKQSNTKNKDELFPNTTNPSIIRVDDYNSLTEISDTIKSEYVIIDMTGMSLDTLKFLMRCNFIFLITTGKDFPFDITTLKAIQEVSKKFGNIKIKMFFNKTDKQEYEIYTEDAVYNNIDLFKTFLPERKIYSNLITEDFKRKDFDDELMDVFNEIYSVILEF